MASTATPPAPVAPATTTPPATPTSAPAQTPGMYTPNSRNTPNPRTGSSTQNLRPMTPRNYIIPDENTPKTPEALAEDAGSAIEKIDGANVTIDPSRTPEQRREDRRVAKRSALTKNLDVLIEKVSTPSMIVRAPWNPRKRRRGDDDDDGSGDDGGGPPGPPTGAGGGGETPPQPGDPPTADNQLPLPRLPMDESGQVRPPIDIAKRQPQPLQIKYKPHPLKDRSDAFYTEAFRRIFRRAENWVNTYFCLHDLDQGEFYQPWAIEFSPGFLNWAETVAEMDPTSDEGWDEMLRSTVQRKWLLMGILMQILKVKVFDEELFGANEQQLELMHGIERALFTREGFSRTALRASTTRTILSRNPVTEAFYPCASHLTAQIFLLFQPLTTFLYALPPPVGTKLPLIQDMYQSLHNLVSTAAYLSLAIRLSPTIFYFTPLQPGTIYNPDEQHSLDLMIYTKSKQAVVDDYQIAVNQHRAEKQPLDLQIKTLKAERKEDSWAYATAKKKLSGVVDRMPMPPGQGHMAMTKIAVWPVITRYKPGSKEDEMEYKDGDAVKSLIGGMDGLRVYPICKGASVCYYGEMDERGATKYDCEGKISLRQHVKIVKERGRNTSGDVGFMGKLGVAVTAGAVVWSLTNSGQAGELGGQAFASLDAAKGMLEGFFGDRMGGLSNYFQFIGAG